MTDRDAMFDDRIKEVAEAVMFMLTRRKGVVVRDLVILPNSVDL